jgi:hypothetical protein
MLVSDHDQALRGFLSLAEYVAAEIEIAEQYHTVIEDQGKSTPSIW